LKTRNYPQEIEEQSITLQQTTERRDEAKAHLEEITDVITGDVLRMTDPDTGKPAFTNDKARELGVRERQRASGEYQKWASILQTAEFERAAAAARLERLRGEFSESKLARRERVAAIEAAIG
jgi:hypothetical protein